MKEDVLVYLKYQ